MVKSNTLPNDSNHSAASSKSASYSQGGSKGNLVSITVRKDDNPKAKAGIQLEQDSNGQVTVTNIAKNGLFGDSELEIGDVILSVNRRRLSEGEGPDVLLKLVHKYQTISIAVRKQPLGVLVKEISNSNSNSKPTKNKQTKGADEDINNNQSKVDTYYGGMSEHNADGSIKVQRRGQQQQKRISATMTVTISARKKIKKKSSSSSTTSCGVGLVLEIKNKKLVVADILPKSIFGSTKLEVGDTLLSINDMSFRTHSDVEYAMTIMDNARLVVTLVVEKGRSTINKKHHEKKKSKKYNSVVVVKPSVKGEEGNDVDADIDSATTSSTSITDSSSDDSSGGGGRRRRNNRRSLKSKSEYDFEIETEFKIEKYRPITIAVPKSCSSQDVGLEFKVVKTTQPGNGRRQTTWVYVHKISDDSIFVDTSLEKGDKVISINNVDFRTTTDTRLAYKTCFQCKEFVTLVVLKNDESIYKEKEFCFDNSVTNLEWQV